MSFGKKQKQQTTQYERENQQIGRDAYQNIQPAVDRMNTLAMNPDEYRKNAINTYWNAENSAQWSDAQRNMLRNLSNATAHNYAATGGGYSSAGNKYYDDVSRLMNDYNARLWDKGIEGSQNMLTQDYNLTTNDLENLRKLHAGAQTADAIDAYNKVIDQSNKTWYTEPLAQIGNVVEALPIGGYKYIGTGMKLGANALSKDYSDTLARLSGQFNGTTDPNAYKNSATSLGGLVSGSMKNLLGDTSTQLGQWAQKYNNQQPQQTQYANYDPETLRRMFVNGQIDLDTYYRLVNG